LTSVVIVLIYIENKVSGFQFTVVGQKLSSALAKTSYRFAMQRLFYQKIGSADLQVCNMSSPREITAAQVRKPVLPVRKSVLPVR